MIDADQPEALIQRLVDRSNLMREDAEAAIAIYLGEDVGDVVPVPLHGAEDRRRFRLELSLESVRRRLRDEAEAPAKSHG